MLSRVLTPELCIALPESLLRRVDVKQEIDAAFETLVVSYFFAQFEKRENEHLDTLRRGFSDLLTTG